MIPAGVPIPPPPVAAAPNSPVARAREAVAEARQRRGEARHALDVAERAAVELERALAQARLGDDLERVGGLVDQRPALQARVAELALVLKHRDAAIEGAQHSLEGVERSARGAAAVLDQARHNLDTQVRTAEKLEQEAATIRRMLWSAEERVTSAQADLVRLVGDPAGGGQ